MTYLRTGSLFTPTRNIWVPSRKLSDTRGFISPALIGGIASSRRRTATATVEIGYNTVGASTATGYTGYIYCQTPFTAPETGTITSVFLYSENDSAARHIKVGLYADDAGSPKTLIAGSPCEFVGEGTWALEWHEFTPTAFPVQKDSIYWLTLAVATDSLTLYFDAGTQHYKGTAYGSAWPATFSSDGTLGRKVSVYGILTYP